MYDKNEIIARLANGEDAQAIADEIANTLNAALNEFLTSQEKEKKNAAKVNAADNVIETILNFVEDFYPDFFMEEMREMTGADLVSICDEAAEEAKKLKNKLDDIEELLKGIEINSAPKKMDHNDKDAIEKFLDEYIRN